MKQVQVQKQVQKKKSGIKVLLEIFKEHIGEENGISIRNLFKEYYGILPENISEFEVWYKFICLQRMLNYLRRKTYAFVVSKGDKYFVVTSHEEASEYVMRLNNTIKKIEYMLKRCDEAIDKEFYKKLEKNEKMEKPNKIKEKGWWS